MLANELNSFESLRRDLDALQEHEAETQGGVEVTATAPTALPSVTILAAGSTARLRASGGPERWSSGDLLALSNALGRENTSSENSSVFFTPIGSMSVPSADLTLVESSNPETVSFHIQPHDRWQDVEIQCALLPWGSPEVGEAVDSDSVVRLARELMSHRGSVSVDLERDGRRLSLTPSWGVSHAPYRCVLEGIRFPISYCSSAVAGFIVRLKLSRQLLLGPNDRAPHREPVSLHFRVPISVLRAIWSNAGLAATGEPGISVYPNALPLANVDLQAWTSGQPYAQFLEDVDAKPIGIAGVFPYVHGEARSLSNEVSPVLKLHVNPDDEALANYTVAGGFEDVRDKHLLMWVSRGPELNGRKFVYQVREPRQPLERVSDAFADSSCCVPCFAGADFCGSRPGDESSLQRWATSYPQTHVFSRSVLAEVECCLSSLGYELLAPPTFHIEVRIVEGVRRRVGVVRCGPSRCRPIEGGHLTLVEQFLLELVPFDTKVIVEQSP